MSKSSLPQNEAFIWDWATGVSEMLYDGQYTYLVGHDTAPPSGVVGWEGSHTPMGPVVWTYALPDALGSVRQETDATGAVTAAREWSPYGVEVGTEQAGLGYTGEWFDTGVGLQYLRARWLAPQTGIFLTSDAVEANHPYQYANANPLRYVDPSGHTATAPPWWIDMITTPHWKKLFMDTALRHNIGFATGLGDEQFAAILASVVLIEGGNLGGASDPNGGFEERAKAAIGNLIGGWPDILRIPVVKYFKTGEILLNKWLALELPVCVGECEALAGADAAASMNFSWLCQNIARKYIDVQSEGIVNIHPDIRSRVAEYGIDVQGYKTFWPTLDPPYSRQETISAGIWYGQEQWIEYLGASFHVVTEMAQQYGVSLSTMNEWGDVESIRAFSQWHSRGIVQAFPYEELGPVTGAWYNEDSLSIAEEPWSTNHRNAQEFAKDYYAAVRRIMWDALNIWAQ